MNQLPTQTRVQILTLLCEGASIRAISRIVGVSQNTVSKLLMDVGIACQDFHDAAVRGVGARFIECDEIWSFCYAKARNAPHVRGNPDYAGSVWTWTAIDRDSKLLISWLVRPTRDARYAMDFMRDLQSRLANRVQLTTDGHRSYLVAVESVFGDDIDYAQIVKHYDSRGRYDGSTKTLLIGDPDPDMISTSYVERHNGTMREEIRRYTRKTKAHSKQIQQHVNMLALYYVWYNFCRIHSSIRTTPAVAAGLSDRPHEMEWILDLIGQNFEIRSN